MIRRFREWLGLDTTQPWTRGEKISCAGFLMLLLGASAADSDRAGLYAAIGITLAGLIFLGIGSRLVKHEEKNDATIYTIED